LEGFIWRTRCESLNYSRIGTMWQGLLILLVAQFCLEGVASLKCYKCINFSCSECPFLCKKAKEFTLEKLNSLYFRYGQNSVPTCPEPGDKDGWTMLEAHADTCDVDSNTEGTCALGRFKLVTTNDNDHNVTSYGTSLGCARRRLFDVAKAALKINECSMIVGVSPKRMSLVHTLEVEQCFALTEMCRYTDFCISPEQSVVKIFRDDLQDETRVTVVPLLILVLIVGTLIALLFLIGIKYGG